MNRFFLTLFALASAFLVTACTTVTDDFGDAYKDMNITFHDKKFMKKGDMKVPDGVNEKRFNKLPFLIGFHRNNPKNSGDRISSDTITDKEYQILKTEFEQVLVASKRFPVATIIEGRADGDLRQLIRNGLANAAEFDPAELEEAEYIINVTAYLGYNSTQSGYQKKMTTTMTLVCSPVIARNNKPLDWFPAFTITAKKDIYAKADSTGRVIDGAKLYTPEQRERLHVELFRRALVEFIDHIYNCFPAGGVVTDIDDDMVSVRASRATGLQPDMETVVYAREKGVADGLRIPLYNATLVTMAQEGNSELKIWRKTDNARGKKIIKLIKDDFGAAKKQYDFFAATSGIPKPPDFIKVAEDF